MARWPQRKPQRKTGANDVAKQKVRLECRPMAKMPRYGVHHVRIRFAVDSSWEDVFLLGNCEPVGRGHSCTCHNAACVQRKARLVFFVGSAAAQRLRRRRYGWPQRWAASPALIC
eukprot:6195191-Pleurochrysis_carterae.AAC.1